ncbi:MAG TPA: DNA methyltransferase [Gemmatimonadaceae bacterium]|nr:DNA methyltransferase [Gemmatimonadaceae bacterium]
MLTLTAAAALLARASTSDSLAPLAQAAGFSGTPLPLDADMRTALGLASRVRETRILRGEGTLRALLLECAAAPSLRESVSAVASRLATRAPHLLWLVLAAQPDSGTLVLASWSPERSRPRVAALFVDREHVMPSDAETVCALAATAGGPDVLTHARWLEVLGREALSRRFYRALERVVGTVAREGEERAPLKDCQELALLHVSRLLFLSFLEAKGWLDGNRRFLAHGFEACMAEGGGYQRRLLLPLFFGTLNTPPRQRAPAARALGRIPFLNGGLFARSALERRHRALRFSDEGFGLVFGELLTRYRFTAREDRVTWSEAAIDPEMLGRAFESLMASRERRASGAFYTPQPLVTSVTHAALLTALAGDGVDGATVDAALRGEIASPGESHAAGQTSLLRARVAALRVLDPACGSGAFLVHALEELAALAARLGDARPKATIRRELLTRSIFGVDVNPTAVWLCELRLWLSVVIESEEADPLKVVPLPNLDRHIRVGDSLSGSAFDVDASHRAGTELARLRERYARSSGARKRTVGRALDRAERSLVLAHLDAELARAAARRRDLLSALRGRDLFGEHHRAGSLERAVLEDTRLRARELRQARRALRDGGALPFAFVTHFADAAARGGFDVVLGNPPWVRLHRIPPALRARLRARYAVFADAAWRRGARAAHAGAGFAAQVDLASLFVERSLALLRPRGTLALLLPSKLWRSLSGGGVRRLVRESTQVVALEDWSESPAVFDAAVYPSLLVARRVDAANGATINGAVSTSRGMPASNGTARAPRASAPTRVNRARSVIARSTTARTAPIAAALHRRDGALRWTLPQERLSLDADPASPWLSAPSEVRAAFDRLARAGTPLADGMLGRPALGLKCGCNEAFLVRASTIDPHSELVRVENGRRSGLVERALLRPLVRGEGVSPWVRSPSDDHLLWTHSPDGSPLTRLPPHAERWLAPYKRVLQARTDFRGRMPWWSLFRTGTASSRTARVVWADLSRSPRACVLPAGDPSVALNSCYVLACSTLEDAQAFAALLNSALAAAWLHLLAEPARGGYRRYLAWTVALLPVPREWTDARARLAPLAARALRQESVSDAELLEAAVRAYHVRAADMAPLIAWSAR